MSVKTGCIKRLPVPSLGAGGGADTETALGTRSAAQRWADRAADSGSTHPES